MSVVTASRADSIAPVFLFGFGRCGSTFWQTLLCRTASLWIWGEHGGIMRPLLESRQKLDDVRNLFPAPQEPPLGLDALTSDDPDLGTRLAWNNGFRASDLDDELRHLIDALMRRGLPEHRTRWGFKEIRYGRTSETEDVPRQLMELFPSSIVVLTLRHPRATIESTIKANLRPRTARGWDRDHVRDAYDRTARAWRRTIDSHLDLAADAADRVVQVRIESIPAGRAALGAALGVTLPADHPPVNALPNQEHHALLAHPFAECWESWRPKLASVMQRAGYDSAP